MKILALDIETRPAVVYTWSLYQPIIGVDQIIDPGGMMCFVAKWVGKRGTIFRSEWYDNATSQGGKQEMLEKLWELLDQADAVLHFNGESFDIPHIQREFMEAGMKPPSPFKQIDLYKTVKRQGRFLSNKLAHVGPRLGLEGKVENGGFKLWKSVMEGDVKAQALMKRYNKRDVTLLEEAYDILKPWIPSHPSHAALDGKPVCPRCGGDDLQWRGYSTTAMSKFRRFQCQGCGGWGKSSKRVSGTTTVAL